MCVHDEALEAKNCWLYRYSIVHVSRENFARHKDVIKEKGADFGPCFKCL